jgi:hypothetical protein
MKIATILLSLLDLAAAIVLTVIIYQNIDEMFLGLDVFLAWAIPILALITAVPALLLSRNGQRAKSALVLAIAFPIGFAGLLAAVFVYFTYM